MPFNNKILNVEPHKSKTSGLTFLAKICLILLCLMCEVCHLNSFIRCVHWPPLAIFCLFLSDCFLYENVLISYKNFSSVHFFLSFLSSFLRPVFLYFDEAVNLVTFYVQCFACLYSVHMLLYRIFCITDFDLNRSGVL